MTTAEIAKAVEQLAFAGLKELAPAIIPAAEIAADIGNLVVTIITARSPSDAVARAAQNALADSEDLAAEEVADAILRGGKG